MISRRVAAQLVALLAACLVALTLLYRSNARQALVRTLRPSPAFRPVTDAALRSAAQNHEWVMYGRDYTNRRFSPLAQINTWTVQRLQPAWIHQHQPSGGGFQQSTPLFVDGVLYYTAPLNVLMAVSASTGAELWRYEHKLGRWKTCCGPANRGVAIYGNKVYMATLDAHLVALERRTGAVVWDVEVADADSGYSETMAPLAVGGRIILGVAGAEYGLRGFVDAYDAETGARRWRFWTIPSPEEGGWWGRWVTRTADGELLHRNIAREKADSAHYADAWKRGGGSVWTTPAYDPELDLLYVPVGNPGPIFDGSTRPGDNLYTASIVAIEAATGKLRWHHQLVPHDLWDYDAANPPILVDLTIDGRPVPAVVHAGKTGWVYVLDRRTGARVLRSEPFVPQLNLFAPGSPQYLPIGQWGGAQWMPSAYDPRTSLMYVLGIHQPKEWREPPEKGSAALWTRPETAKLRTQQRAILSAVDLRTGKIRWLRGHGCEGVGLVTAGNLTFCGTRHDGVLKAIDTRNGEEVWEFRAGGTIATGPITFSLHGRQYLVVASRGALIAFTLPSR